MQMWWQFSYFPCNCRLNYRKIFEDSLRFFINTLNKTNLTNRPFCKGKEWFVEAASRETDFLLKLETQEEDRVRLTLWVYYGNNGEGWAFVVWQWDATVLSVSMDSGIIFPLLKQTSHYQNIFPTKTLKVLFLKSKSNPNPNPKILSPANDNFEVSPPLLFLSLCNDTLSNDDDNFKQIRMAHKDSVTRQKQRCQVWDSLEIWQQLFFTIDWGASSRACSTARWWLSEGSLGHVKCGRGTWKCHRSSYGREKYTLTIVTTARQRMLADISGENGTQAIVDKWVELSMVLDKPQESGQSHLDQLGLHNGGNQTSTKRTDCQSC